MDKIKGQLVVKHEQRLNPGVTMNNTISAQDTENYREKGYLIIENALSQQVVDDLCNEAAEVCLGKR